MFGYLCFDGKGRRCEVRAETSYAAQIEAAKQFGMSEQMRWKISAILAEKLPEVKQFAADRKAAADALDAEFVPVPFNPAGL